jgi:hypothetical protein
MVVAGIDLGLTGGVVVMDDKRVVLLADLIPTLKLKKKGGGTKSVIDVVAVKVLIGSIISKCDIVFMERTAPMMKFVGSKRISNAPANWNQGYCLGIFEAFLCANNIKYEMFPPKEWQDTFSIHKENKLDTKAQSYMHVCRLFAGADANVRTPKGAIRDGICDAFLIAEYGLRKLGMPYEH